MDLDNNSRAQTYPLPLTITPIFALKLVAILFIMGCLFIAIPFIMPIEEAEGAVFFHIIIFDVFIPVLGMLFIVSIFYQNVFKKNKIWVTEQTISINSLFIKKTIRWEDVVDISEYSLNHNDFIGFVTQSRMNKLAKGGLNATMGAAFGGLNEIAIPLKQLGELDRETVINTITTRFIKQLEIQQNENQLIELDDDFDDDMIPMELPTNRFKGILLSLIISTTTAFIYAFSIYLIEINILILPFIGLFIISFYYEKHVKVADFGILDKLWVGMMGGFSVLAANIILIFILTEITPSIFNIIAMTYSYLFEILPNQWLDEMTWILMMVVVTCTGFSFGPSINWFWKKKTDLNDFD
ncbi:hypothetical protein ACR30L_09875 [Psychromonas sp. PT13]|uniref:hypothetical protein n=1 Tax=Psychromonas sp. PT13 TaxID=3439547 RepID=UPI003EBF0093